MLKQARLTHLGGTSRSQEVPVNVSQRPIGRLNELGAFPGAMALRRQWVVYCENVVLVFRTLTADAQANNH